jgi:hypothetical protein
MITGQGRPLPARTPVSVGCPARSSARTLTPPGDELVTRIAAAVLEAEVFVAENLLPPVRYPP